jgi:hypothetical protein
MNKHLATITISLIVIFGTSILNAEAATYSPGTLIKEAGKPQIYYLSIDGKRYHVPNAQTFFTWYRDFRNVKELTKSDIDVYPIGKQIATVHPGTVLVKFPTGAKVYAVENGAKLRWITTESVARSLYGHSWTRRIVHLPSSQTKYYNFGEDITDATEFNRNLVVNKSRTIDSELTQVAYTKAAMAEAVTAKQNSSANTVGGTNVETFEEEIDYTPNILSLGTDLRNRLSPNFHPDVLFYRVVADAGEDKMKVTYTLDDPMGRVIVSGLSTTKDTPITLSVRTGRSVIPLHVRTRDGKRKSYYITVVREKSDNNNRLGSLYEDLEANFDPAFHPAIYKYNLRAKFEEDRIVLRGNHESSKATMKLNNELWAGWHKTVLLDPGENIINVNVQAESGNVRNYELKIHRQASPNSEATELNSLYTDLSSRISPTFDPDQTSYYVRAKHNEDRTVITATPVNNSAHVLIDGQSGTQRSVRLFTGRNEFDITVELNTGHSTSYKLIVDRLQEF